MNKITQIFLVSCIQRKVLLLLLIVLMPIEGWSASYPVNRDYGSQGDFIAKRGTEFGRTADLTPIGPVLINLPEAPGSTSNGVEWRFETTAWDLSDLTNPQLIRSLTCPTCFSGQPMSAHGTIIRLDKERNEAQLFAVDPQFVIYDPNGADSNAQVLGVDRTPDNYVGGMLAPYATAGFWEYGFQPGPLWIREPRTPFTPTPEFPSDRGAPWLGAFVAEWDHLGLTSVTGFTAFLGELLIVASDQQSTGIAIYDRSGLKEGETPRLISQFRPNLTEPDGSPISIGGYWMEPYGANKIVWAARPRDIAPARDYPAMYVVDFTDPESPQLTCEIYFDLDRNDPADGDGSSDPMYVNFQDQYAFVDHFKVDIDACEQAYAGDQNIDATELAQIAYKFDDIANHCDGSQYFRPLGQVGVFGGYDWWVTDSIISYTGGTMTNWQWHTRGDGAGFNPVVTLDAGRAMVSPAIRNGETVNIQVGDVFTNGFTEQQYTVTNVERDARINEQGMCFMVTSDVADTRAPFVSGHRPLADQIDVPVDTYIHIHIPETLRSETLVNATRVVRVDDNGNEIESITFESQFSHTGTLSIWPNSDLVVDASYRVELTGIQDYMGNTMEDYSFVFSTGDTVIAPPPPETTPPPTYAGPTYYPNQSSEMSCLAESQENNIWVVNPDNDSVTIIDTNHDAESFLLSEEVINEIDLGYKQPTSVTHINGVYAITYRGDDRVAFLNSSGVELFSVDTGYGTQPVASVTDGQFLYVSLYGSGEVLKLDIANQSIISRLEVGAKPKAMALREGRLLVTRFISTPDHGEVYDIATSGNMSLTRAIRVNKVGVADDLDHGSGVPNMLSSIVISPDGETAYITAIKANVDRGLFRNGVPLDSDNTVRPMLAILDLVQNRDANVDTSTREGTLDFDNAADPSFITYLADGEHRVTSLRGNNVVLVQNNILNTSAQFNTGFAPRSACATLRTLYVKNFTDRSISAIDVAPYMHDGTRSSRTLTINTVANEVLTAEEKQGLRIFYHSSQPEMGDEGYMTCASCHTDGGHDGMTWDLTSLGEGLRNTLSLNGTKGTRFGDLHWSGNFDEVQDFELQIEQLNGGDGLIEGRTFNGQSPLGFETANQSADLDALAAYVSSLGKDSLQRSPYRTATGGLTDAAQQGQQLFQEQGCASCHRGSAFRDGLQHDVGTLTTASGDRLSAQLTAIRTPSLVELWETAPYFHDGSAATLDDVLSRGTHQVAINQEERGDLIEYLLSIDRNSFIDDDAEWPESLVNQAPVVENPIEGQIVMLGSTYYFAIPENTFRDPDGDNLTVSVDTLPTWMNFDANAQVLSGVANVAGTVVIDVEADDGNGGRVTNTFMLNVSDPGPVMSLGILRESWTGISGTELDAFARSVLDGTAAPGPIVNSKQLQSLSSFSGPVDVADNYLSRISGIFYAPESGEYTFWISGDDNVELWLSSDNNSVNKSLIAQVPGWTQPLEWDKYPEQQSSAVFLTAGQAYYLEAIHKEGGGGDNVDVAWQRPSNGQLEVIAGEYFEPPTVINQAPEVEAPIADQSTIVDERYEFEVPVGTFTDPDGDVLTLLAGGITPSWLSFDPATRILSGTPTDVEEVQIEVVANDSRGGIAADVFSLSILDAAENGYQYYRFTPTKLRNDSANSIELSEFSLFFGDVRRTAAIVTNPAGSNPASEQPENANDNDLNSKWLDFNKGALVYDFGFAVDIDGYSLTTARGPFADRQPVRWVLEGSVDNLNWVVLDDQRTQDYPMPSGGRVETPLISLAPVNNIAPVITIDGYDNGDTINLIVGESFVTPTATATDDIDGSVDVVRTGTVDTNQVGAYTINYSATDSASNVANALLTVDVRAANLPLNAVDDIESGEVLGDGSIRILISDLLENDDPGQGGLSIPYLDDWINGVAQLNSDAGEIIFTPSGAENGQFTYALVDSSNAVDWAIVTVLVQPQSVDTVPPVISITGYTSGDSINLTLGEVFTTPLATAQDDVDGVVPVTTSGVVDTSQVGSYGITYSATDAAGNSASAQLTVNVLQPLDTEPPVITIDGYESGDTINLTVGDAFITPAATAIDNIDGSVAVAATGVVNVDQVGSYTISYSAVDSAGNAANVGLTIIVSEASAGASAWILEHFSDAPVTAGEFTGRQNIEMPHLVHNANNTSAGKYAFAPRNNDSLGINEIGFVNVSISGLYRDNSAYGAGIATSRDGDHAGTAMYLSNVHIDAGWEDFRSYSETNFDGIVLDGAEEVYGQDVIITNVNADSAIDNKANVSQFVRLNVSGNVHRSLRYWRVGPHYLVDSTIENSDGAGAGHLMWFRNCDSTVYIYNSTFDGSPTVPLDEVRCDQGSGTPNFIYLDQDPRETGDMHEMFNPSSSSDTVPPEITIAEGAHISGDIINLTVGDAFTVPAATATDNVDGEVAVMVSDNVDTNQVGSYTVTYSATDAAGNVANAALVIEVRAANVPLDAVDDIESGEVLDDGRIRILFSELFDNDSPGQGGLNIPYLDDWINGVAQLNSAAGEIIFTPSGADNGQFTYALVDSSGAVDWAIVTVIVESSPSDTIPPVINIAGYDSGDVINLVVGAAFANPPATAIDNIDGTVNVNISNNVDTSEVGRYVVNYSAVDTVGNVATAQLSVIVSIATPVDTIPPVISIDGYADDDIINLIVGDAFTIPSATAVDNVDGVVAVTTMGTVNVDQVGSYIITYSAVDAANNTASSSLMVNVSDDVSSPPNAVSRVRQFTFNHSLWQHNFDNNAVTGYWVGDFANASGTTYAWNGQFGQLDYHGLPPSPSLGSTNSEDLWNNEDPRDPNYRETFEEVDLDNVIIMPDNFSQGGISEVSPFHMESALRVIDYLGTAQPGKPIIIYEHWPELNGASYPPTSEQENGYHALQLGSYHQWFINYQNAIAQQRPGATIRMIPVGPILSEIFTNPIFQAAEMSWQDRYDDNDPHGKPSLYFLAGLITYQAIFGQPVIDSYVPPSQVDVRIRNQFDTLNDFIWQRLNFYNTNGVRVWADSTSSLVPTVQVSNTAELNEAINNLVDGGVISLEAGVYTCVRIEGRSYSAESPLVLLGESKQVVFEDNTYGGGSRACTSSLDIRESSYIGLRNFSIQRGLFSLSISGSDHVIVDDVDVSLPLQSGIHVNKNSSDVDIINSHVSDTGRGNPQWGECIYVGTGGSQGFPDETVRVWIEGNEIHDCGYGEGINIKPEVFDSTVINNHIYDISPGHPDYSQYNSAAITVEGGRGSSPTNNHRPNDSRNVWVENNLIERVTKSVPNDNRATPVREDGMRSFASGIMVGGTGVHVVGNTINDYEEHGVWLNNYGDLELPVYLFGNQIDDPIESLDSNVPNQMIFRTLSDQRVVTTPQAANTLTRQTWLP